MLVITPIQNADFYFFEETTKILKGLINEKLEKINMAVTEDSIGKEFFCNDFFTIDNSGREIYFSATFTIDKDQVEKYYSQISGVVTEIESLPAKPTKSRIVFNDGDFSAETVQWENQDYTDIKNLFNLSGVERNKMVDDYFIGRFFNEDGLFFVIQESVRRLNGLYFWPKNKSSLTGFTESGSMWK